MSRFNSIQTRLVITVIALITAIVASFAFFSYREIQASLIERFQNEASVIVSPFYTAIGEELPDDADLSLFARVAIISRVSTFFPELVRTFPDVQGILYANPQGEILRSDGVESIVPPALLSSILLI